MRFLDDFRINFEYFHIGYFSRHDDSDDEKSDKNDTKDSSKDDEEEGIFFFWKYFLTFINLGEVNDPADELEKKRNEALKRIQVDSSAFLGT